MSHLHWFSGITWDTQIRDIGWTWVVLAALIGWLLHGFYEFRRDLDD